MNVPGKFKILFVFVMLLLNTTTMTVFANNLSQPTDEFSATTLTEGGIAENHGVDDQLLTAVPGYLDNAITFGEWVFWIVLILFFIIVHVGIIYLRDYMN